MRAWRIEAGRKYRVRGSWYVNGNSTRIYVGVQCLDASGLVTGANAGLVYNVSSGTFYSSADGWVSGESAVFDLAYLQSQKGAAVVSVRLIALLNYSNVAGCVVGLDGLWLEDVTESEAAKGSASAAANSYALAQAEVDATHQEALAAQGHALTAGTEAGYAIDAKDSAVSAKDTAEGAAATATTQATLSATARNAAASMGGGNLAPNGAMNDPALWISHYGSVISATDGYVMPAEMWVANVDGLGTPGFHKQTPGVCWNYSKDGILIKPGRKYRLLVDLFRSGELIGNNYFVWRNNTNSTYSHSAIGANTPPDGQWWTASVLFTGEGLLSIPTGQTAQAALLKMGIALDHTSSDSVGTIKAKNFRVEDVTKSEAAAEAAAASIEASGTAIAQAGLAGDYAAAALNEKLAAQDAHGGANAARDVAVQARDDAEGFSLDAMAASVVSVEAKDRVETLSGLNYRGDWLDGGAYWVTGDWLTADQLAAAPSVTTLAGTSIVTDANEGKVLQCSNLAAYFHERSLRPRKEGQIVRVTVRVRVVTDPTSGSVTFTARQEQHRADGTREPNVTVFGSTQVRRYATIPSGSLTLTAAQGWQTLTVEFDSDALMASNETHWLLGVFVSGGNGAVWQVGRITPEDVTAAKAEAGIVQEALLETNGRLSAMVGFKAEVEGAYASVKAFAFTDLNDPNATPYANLLLESQYYTFRGGLVLFENAELKSSNFVAGVSGWRIDEEGNAEFNSLISRSALTPDAVSDLEQVYLSSDYRWPETSLTERAKITLGVTEPTDLWLVHFAGKARGFGPQDAQGNVIEVRGLLYVQRRVKESGVWSAWETVDYFQSAYNPAVWQRFNFSENFAGDYEDVEYRVASAVPNGAHLPSGENNFSRISISARRPVR